MIYFQANIVTRKNYWSSNQVTNVVNIDTSPPCRSGVGGGGGLFFSPVERNLCSHLCGARLLFPGIFSGLRSQLYVACKDLFGAQRHCKDLNEGLLEISRNACLFWTVHRFRFC